MGWTSTHRDKGMTTREFFENEVGMADGNEILASKVVGDTFYAAVKGSNGNISALVILLQWSTRAYFNFSWKSFDEFSAGGGHACPDKILDLLSPIEDCQHEETYCKTCNAEITDDTGVWMRYANEHETDAVSGPRCYHFMESERQADGSAPFHTPGGHGWCSREAAREFRASSREYNRRVRAAKSVVQGTVIKTAREIEFTSGLKGDTFTYVAKNVFLLHGYRVNLGRGWQATSFEIVEAA